MSDITTTHCKRCAKGFSSTKTHQNHIRYAPQHRRAAPVLPTSELPYVGIPARDVKQIFNAALQLRFVKPDASMVINRTGTVVQCEVVAAILEGALRLLPPDKTEDGQRARKATEAAKAQHAAAAELNFVARFKEAGFDFLDEEAQKEHIREALNKGLQPIRSTPDILFARPVSIHGKNCRWIEYKNTFGFKKNPFVHSKHKSQFRRYVEIFGPGMVVYKLGFEQNLLDIEGVDYARELEVFACL